MEKASPTEQKHDRPFPFRLPTFAVTAEKRGPCLCDVTLLRRWEYPWQRSFRYELAVDLLNDDNVTESVSMFAAVEADQFRQCSGDADVERVLADCISRSVRIQLGDPSAFAA